jgi:hypothetical protein
VKGGEGRPARKGDNLTAFCEPIFYKMWEPQHLTTLWVSTARYRDTFTFTYWVSRIAIIIPIACTCSLCLFIVCILVGSLDISFDRCHFCYIYLFVDVVLLRSVLCSGFELLFLFARPWIVLWFFLFFLCMWKWPILFSGVVGRGLCSVLWSWMFYDFVYVINIVM